MKTKSIKPGSGGFAVTKEKYDPIRKAVMAVMPRNRTGISFKELVAAVAQRVPQELFPKKGSVSWYTKVVQLDLESSGKIERVPSATPQRIRRVG